MKVKPVFYKCLVVGVIVLFIGVAISPSIYANEIQEEKLIEYTTTVCGLDGEKRTVYLTQEESQQVELLLDSIQKQLESTTSMEEAREIYKKGVIELDKYGLLAGLSREEAQKLVTRDLLLSNRQRILDIGFNLTQNIFCLFSGSVYIPYNGPFIPEMLIPIGPLTLFGMILGELIYNTGLEKIGELIAILLVTLSFLNPLKFMNTILSLNCHWEIISFGLKGLVESNDTFLILGYSGLIIYSSEEHYDFNLLGFCLGYL